MKSVSTLKRFWAADVAQCRFARVPNALSFGHQNRREGSRDKTVAIPNAGRDAEESPHPLLVGMRKVGTLTEHDSV